MPSFFRLTTTWKLCRDTVAIPNCGGMMIISDDDVRSIYYLYLLISIAVVTC